MSNSAYPQLEQLLCAYFHQDWCDEHDTEAEVIAEFVQTTWRDEVERTIEQIDRYLADHPTHLLQSVEHDFATMVSVGINDNEVRAWLAGMRNLIGASISHAPVRG